MNHIVLIRYQIFTKTFSMEKRFLYPILFTRFVPKLIFQTALIIRGPHPILSYLITFPNSISVLFLPQSLLFSISDFSPQQQNKFQPKFDLFSDRAMMSWNPLDPPSRNVQ